MAGADMVIRVAEESGIHCVSPDDGQRLFDRLHEALRVGKSVELDFAGVETVGPVFLNVAIGKLFGQSDAHVIEALLHWKNVTEVSERLLYLVIKNAKAHYQLSPEARVREGEIVRRALDSL